LPLPIQHSARANLYGKSGPSIIREVSSSENTRNLQLRNVH